MNKTFINTLTILMVSVALACAWMFALKVNAQPKEEIKNGKTYTLATVVVEIDEELSVIVCEDSNGNLWEFFGGILEWEIGDGCAMVMYDNATTTIYDDEIVETTLFRLDKLSGKIL